ncbi:TonB-linked SusC/RagA family outer membrane protein [Lacibacter cauensis]|uniref:TonB-linked SusC/RagA family outer membrane protein n=1 Tax=Lacibacter cauensis TaxID=510947 RepID=A0A562SJN3_9BACT|nr:TonB-dependent receptor [Lacibacter cauensis]TWI81465.1 TonB-linked SusC/RagA family outer membrane protein [Lacibacter cauensis]
MRKLLGLAIALLLSLCQVWAQTKDVTGKVTDSKDGSPLAGATVKVKGTTKVTTTGADGTFKISFSGNNAVLQISSVGYEDQEVSVSGGDVAISMTPGTTSLTEVLVVGYGQTVKRDLTTSVSRVKGADVANTPVPNFIQGVQGRAAGVFVESQSGKVGEGIKVRIRGASSISASNDPLYVIDGIPMNTGSLSGNALADINFNDVESFEILKDAAATAIYGSRGANGVVLITTKKGKSGKAKFSVNMQYGTNTPTNKRGFLNSTEYIAFFKEAAVNAAKYHFNRAGNGAGFPSEAAAITYMTNIVEGRFNRYSGINTGGANWRADTVNTNWEDLAFQESQTKIIEANASGGNEKTKYFISGSYNDQDGILFYNNFKRYAGRINLDQELNSRLKVGVNSTVSRSSARRVGADNLFNTPMQIVALAPITPVRNNQGQLFDRPTTTYYNPLIETENASYVSTTFRNINSVYGQLNIMKGLNFRSEYGLDVLTQNDNSFYGRRTITGQGTNGVGNSDWLRSVRYTTNNYFTYNTTIKEKHDLDATLGMAFEKLTNDISSVEGQQFANDDLRNIANAATITGGTSSLSEFAILSYFGRVNYKFNDKYLLGLSARMDGSSVFGENKRYGFFPAASVGWVVSEESFLRDVKAISFLKVRASYGSLGNQQGFGNYAWRGVYGTGRYAGNASLAPASLQNDLLTWETTNQLDVGFELGILKNKLVFEADYYNKRSAGNGRGFIYNYPLPLTSGFAAITRNIGEIENKGIEFTLNTINVDVRNFKWTTSINVSHNKNKVLKIDGQQDTLSFNDGRYMNALIVGQPIGVHYGPRYAGVDPANGDALYYEQDGKTTTNDYNSAGNFVVGDPNPKWFGGVTNTFTYKGFELSVLFQGVFDYEVVNGAGGFMSARGDWFDNQTKDQLKRWQKPGDVTNVPEARLNWFGDFNSPSVSTQYMEDASYVRLKQLTLAYNIPSSVLNKVKLSSVRAYVTGVNLFTWTKYTGWDPEVNTDYRAGNINQGGDFYAAPQIRSVTFGLNIGF